MTTVVIIREAMTQYSRGIGFRIESRAVLDHPPSRVMTRRGQAPQ